MSVPTPPVTKGLISTENDLLWEFLEHRDQTTLVMGVQAYLERIMRGCEELRRFVRSGYGESDGSFGREVERYVDCHYSG
jgi:hypothetical protein